jgi:hypothetical protein
VTDYAALLQQKNAEMAPDAVRVRQLLDIYGGWIEKYRGGMPAAWMATIMLWESNGKADLVGDASLGEYGLYQVAAYVPSLFGLPADARLDPESNVAIASLEYAYEQVLWYMRYPGLVELGSGDAWKLARLSFAVGRAGSYQLADLAHPTESGAVYDAIKAYVSQSGGVQLGGQSPDKVWFRVMSIDTQWQLAELANGGSMSPGSPQLIPNPPAGAYTIPANAIQFFDRPLSPVFAIAGIGLLVGLIWFGPELWGHK